MTNITTKTAFMRWFDKSIPDDEFIVIGDILSIMGAEKTKAGKFSKSSRIEFAFPPSGFKNPTSALFTNKAIGLAIVKKEELSEDIVKQIDANPPAPATEKKV